MGRILSPRSRICGFKCITTGPRGSWICSRENRKTLDFDLQYRRPLGRWQDLTWGLGYRYTESENSRGNFTLAFMPSEQVNRIFNTFVQDEITLVKERLRLTIGSQI